jgi:hypothetical protein
MGTIIVWMLILSPVLGLILGVAHVMSTRMCKYCRQTIKRDCIRCPLCGRMDVD